MPKHIPRPGDSDFDWSQYDKYKKANDPLGEAKVALARAQKLSDNTDAPNLGGLRDRMNDLSEESRNAQPYSGREWARGLTEGTDSAAGLMGLAAMAPTPASPLLATASGALMMPGAARRMIMPEEDESRTEGAIQAALGSLGFGAVRGAAGGAIKGVSKKAKSSLSALKHYIAPGEDAGVTATREAVDMARSLKDIGYEPRTAGKIAGWPLGKSKATNISHLTQLPEEDMIESMLKMRQQGFGADAALKAHDKQARGLAKAHSAKFNRKNTKSSASLKGLQDSLDSRITGLKPDPVEKLNIPIADADDPTSAPMSRELLERLLARFQANY